MRVGVISDTHGLLRPEAMAVLRKAAVEHIFHAGDIGDMAILKVFESIAPVTAIRGNTDLSGPCSALPPTDLVELGGKFIYLVHSVHDLDLDPVVAGISVVISGHSHRSSIETRDGVLYFNPGSAGPRRFSLPISVGLLTLEDSVRATIIDIPPDLA